MCFYCLCGFICDFLEFSLVKSSKIFTTHCFQQDTNFKHKKVGFVKAVFSIFQIYVFYRCKKSGLIDFPKKQDPTKVKYLLPICQMLWNFTEGNICEKIHCQFCFLCSCWRQKISKNTDVFLRVHTDYLSFRPQRACDRKTIGSHLKVWR